MSSLRHMTKERFFWSWNCKIKSLIFMILQWIISIYKKIKLISFARVFLKFSYTFVDAKKRCPFYTGRQPYLILIKFAQQTVGKFPHLFSMLWKNGKKIYQKKTSKIKLFRDIFLHQRFWLFDFLNNLNFYSSIFPRKCKWKAT